MERNEGERNLSQREWKRKKEEKRGRENEREREEEKRQKTMSGGM